MVTPSVAYAFGLTLFAGLSTGIGSLLALVTKKTNSSFLAGSLGFSAGVMIYVSMIEIFPKARTSLAAAMGEPSAYWYTTVGFFGGMVLIAIIDQLVPSFENPHEMRDIAEMQESANPTAGPVEPEAAAEAERSKKLLRMGWFSALAIAIHNFPEGLATFAAAMNDPALGWRVAVAIAIHNIPEGIAVSVPIYFATGSRRKAFGLSFLSGLSEPLGALLGYVVLSQFIDARVFGTVFAGVAGIMVFISLDELLPTAEKYGEHHLAMFGVVSGMVVMALSLLLFA